MSDPTSNARQPLEETPADDDLVGRAHDSLAEAEAARREAVAEPGDIAAEPVASQPASARDDIAAEPVAPEPVTTRDDLTTSDDVAAEPVASAPAVSERVDRVEPQSEDRVAERVEPRSEDRVAEPPVPTSNNGDRPDNADTDDRSGTSDAAAPAAASVYADESDDDRFDRYERYAEPDQPAASDRYDTVTAAPVAAPAATSSEPVAPQPIFVQAPEAPRPRGNRGAAGAIGLLAALAFAVLYLAVSLAFATLAGLVDGADLVADLLATLGSWGFWVPVVVFFFAFWLLGAIINRGRWGAWVIFGLLVGLASWGGYILGELVGAPFWTLTASEGAQLVQDELLAPLGIAAFVIGRELTIWFGAWVAARGRRVTELNVEARREYERTLEAGPQLARL